MARRSVDDRAVRHVLAIVDHDSPDLDEGEERYVRKLVEREQKREDVVGHALREPIHRVEGV